MLNAMLKAMSQPLVIALVTSSVGRSVSAWYVSFVGLRRFGAGRVIGALVQPTIIGHERGALFDSIGRR